MSNISSRTLVFIPIIAVRAFLVEPAVKACARHKSGGAGEFESRDRVTLVLRG